MGHFSFCFQVTNALKSRHLSRMLRSCNCVFLFMPFNRLSRFLPLPATSLTMYTHTHFRWQGGAAHRFAYFLKEKGELRRLLNVGLV